MYTQYATQQVLSLLQHTCIIREFTFFVTACYTDSLYLGLGTLLTDELPHFLLQSPKGTHIQYRQTKRCHLLTPVRGHDHSQPVEGVSAVRRHDAKQWDLERNKIDDMALACSWEGFHQNILGNF